MTKDKKLLIALLDRIIICPQCGALFLNAGWSNEMHNASHRERPVEPSPVPPVPKHAELPTKNVEVGPRCGECRLGLGVHNTLDPQCDHIEAPEALPTEVEDQNNSTGALPTRIAMIKRLARIRRGGGGW